MHVNDLPVGRSVDEVLRLLQVNTFLKSATKPQLSLQAFQFVEKHGEVCPANWQPNKPTINPAKANEYFEKNN